MRFSESKKANRYGLEVLSKFAAPRGLKVKLTVELSPNKYPYALGSLPAVLAVCSERMKCHQAKFRLNPHGTRAATTAGSGRQSTLPARGKCGFCTKLHQIAVILFGDRPSVLDTRCPFALVL